MKNKNIGIKLLTCIMVLMLAISSFEGNVLVRQALAAENTQTVSARMPFRELSAKEIVAEMGTGWNLGNTMDGHTGFTPGETVWQNVETSQGLLKALHDMGFNTIRVPVTWGTMIDDTNAYAIDEKWMSRVQDIVDYAVNLNMYVIINIHHDGAEQMGWLRVSAENLGPVKEKFAGVWKRIAERFKDYDEHVIFESMNEVTGEGSNVARDTAVINEFNRIFVDTVRKTGSNNALRWLSVPGRYTNIANTTNPEMGFALPEDTVKDRLFVSVHYYDWHFGLLETTQQTNFSYDAAKALQAEFQKLETAFTSKGIPVILGEYGAINKQNTQSRAYHMEIVNRICQQIGIVPCYWDQGWYDLTMNPDFSFTLVDRKTYEPIYPEIINAIMRGMFLPGKEDLSDIVLDTQVTPITDLGTQEGTCLLRIGGAADISLGQTVDKAAGNDVILWKCADETVACVEPDGGNLKEWKARVHGTGIGNTVITAYAQSGKAVLDIPVEVRAAKADNPCTGIHAEKESYSLSSGQSVYLNAAMTPAGTDAFLTYRSSDTEVLTVSKIGKIVAKNPGRAYVIITSSDGFTKAVPVTVEEEEAKAEIALSLNVYFNDSEHNYFSNETGEAITVSGEGQYTLAFDTGKDFSKAAQDAGVTGLSNLTAIYIKDDSVIKGAAKKSPLASCDIRYDRITVDGMEQKLLMTQPKSALKASGIFDTNDPINSWDGSVIEGVTVENHVLNFIGMDDPRHVEVTFTLSNMVFEEGAQGIQKPEAKSIEAVGEQMITAENKAPAQLTVKADPSGSGKVVFVSSDASVVSVDNRGIAIGGDQTASVTVYAHADGEAEVIAYTDNGLKAVFTVKAEVPQEAADEPQGTVDSSLEAGDASQPVVDESSQKEAVEASTADKEPAGKKRTLNPVLLVAGIAALAALVFAVTWKIAGGVQPPKEKE